MLNFYLRACCSWKFFFASNMFKTHSKTFLKIEEHWMSSSLEVHLWRSAFSSWIEDVMFFPTCRYVRDVYHNDANPSLAISDEFGKWTHLPVNQVHILIAPFLICLLVHLFPRNFYIGKELLANYSLTPPRTNSSFLSWFYTPKPLFGCAWNNLLSNFSDNRTSDVPKKFNVSVKSLLLWLKNQIKGKRTIK
jgi:hypothetical protein